MKVGAESAGKGERPSNLGGFSTVKLMLTEKQIRVLRYFRDFRRDKGIAPTLDEAARALGVSKITIHEHLKQLSRNSIEHGFLPAAEKARLRTRLEAALTRFERDLR